MGLHLFPSRTEKLSPPAPMVLPLRWESRSPPSFKAPIHHLGWSRGFFIIFVPFMKITLLIVLTFCLSLAHAQIEMNSEVLDTINLSFGDSVAVSSYSSTELPDSIHLSPSGLGRDTLIISDSGDTESRKSRDMPEELLERSALQIFSAPKDQRMVSWRFNNKYLTNELVGIDTSLWMNHLVYPQQVKYETYTFLGNLGSANQYDHFFSRENSYKFLFSRYMSVYSNNASEFKHYNVRTPFTNLYYSTSTGKQSEVEQVFKVFHTQNASRYLNFGVSYDFYGTKGVYANQETRNNIISLFGSYYKGNVQVQLALTNRVYKHGENAGITNHSFIRDTVIEQPNFIPVNLAGAESTTREFSTSTILGYTLINLRTEEKDETGKLVSNYIPLITARLIANFDRGSRVFLNKSNTDEYFGNFYIHPSITRDSVLSQSIEAKAMLEINQFARIPGMPGLRGWVGLDHQRYFFYKPNDFIFSRDDDRISSSHLGVAAFSDSPYLSYQGAIRLYFSGHRADDKEIEGEVRLSPWKSLDMPQLKGKILISESTPDVFYTSYFSNHFKWENSFVKEKRFMLGGKLEAKRWEAEVGYNVIYIKDFIYFNENALPSQTSDVTITSAYGQKNFRFGNGFNFFNRVVWQANTNSQVLSIPNIIAFSAFFYERVLVKNALKGQLGFNVYYRSKFYADGYQPALGQFYNQRQEHVGNYPVLDMFANFKWKRTIIYVKYEHANQGYPDNQYFATYLYPMNPQILKFGVSWMFYD